MSALGSLLAIYSAIALVGAVMGAMVLTTEDYTFTEQLKTEGRAVLGIVLGLFWFVPAALALGWVLIRAWRGVMQCVQLVVPRKPTLPRAEVRQ